MDKICIIDMGSQYSHLIARRVRELGVYSEIISHNISISDLMVLSPKGIILSGGPSSVYEENSPKLEEGFYDHIKTEGIPVLGICYGLHLIIHQLGGNIEPLFYSLDKKEIVWMSHGDQITQMPDGFKSLAKTNTCPIAAFGNEKLGIYGVQFHPEVVNTAKGTIILSNFIHKIVSAKKEWKLENWIETNIEFIKEEVGPNNRVILGLSGGVDSSVCAVLLHKAIGDRLHCIFVNNGVLRKNEEFEVQKQFKEKINLKNFHYVDAESLFLDRLKGVDDPEEKRKVIGHTFIEVFEKKTIELETEYPSIKYLAQGTIYPDRVETAATSTNAAKIKSHHNLTLPENMKLKIIEPLKDLYKDEVRKIGKQLGLESELIDRHPFPGPGLAVRCLGAIDKEKLGILREADLILLEEIRNAGIYNDLWQVFCVLLPIRTVGVMGDFRTYEYICAIRAVESKDVMTASFAKLEWDLLEKIGSRLINEVKGFNRVVYDISNKPPATIEYE
ncbi:MAG: glutamine-hydrolyzing GMP synthase [Promethearchaeota archaeon]